MKGQSVIFEQVLLFMISVAIFIVCFALFQIYEDYYDYVSMNDQIKAVRDIISAQAIQMIKYKDLNVTSSLRIPRRIGGEFYYISFNGTGLNVSMATSNVAANTDFFRLGYRYRFLGNSTSSKGEIVIYKRGNNIIIE